MLDFIFNRKFFIFLSTLHVLPLLSTTPPSVLAHLLTGKYGKLKIYNEKLKISQGSRMEKIFPNSPKLSQLIPNGTKWSTMVHNGSKQSERVQVGSERLKMIQKALKFPQMISTGLKSLKCSKLCK